MTANIEQPESPDTVEASTDDDTGLWSHRRNVARMKAPRQLVLAAGCAAIWLMHVQFGVTHRHGLHHFGPLAPAFLVAWLGMMPIRRGRPSTIAFHRYWRFYVWGILPALAVYAIGVALFGFGILDAVLAWRPSDWYPGLG